MAAELDRRRALSMLSASLPAATAAVSEAVAQAPKPVLKRESGTSISPLPRLWISPETAAKVGRQVWINESGGKADGVTVWNAGEDFPSLGIGHWIWFKEGGHPIFEESFPKLIQFIHGQGVSIPKWLDKQPFPPCRWTSKAEFERVFRTSPELVELRRFLIDTIPQQTQYLLQRTQDSIPKMLAVLPDLAEQQHLLSQLNRVARSSPDLYPLIDYINFKGEGISEKETRLDRETGLRLGWGMRWLLLEMRDTAEGAPTLAEFSRAAKAVLDRRIHNHPPSARWREGWHKRCDTYRKPLV